jgi:hypothetical protein
VANELAAEIVNQTRRGKSEHDRRIRRYDDSYRVWRGVSAPTRVEPWQSKLRPKFGMQVIDTAMVNIVSGKPRCVVRPKGPEHEQAAKAMQSVLDYYVAEDHLVEKLPVFVQSGLIFGPAIAKNHWLYREAMRPTRRKMTINGGDVLVATKPETVIQYDGPTFEPWDVYDAWWDPDARDVDSAAYVVLRSYVSKDDLLRLARNEDANTGIYWNVPELLKAGVVTEESQRAQYQSNSNDKRKEKFELWEVWRETPQGLRLTVVGNGSVVLRDAVSPYWHGKKPIVVAQVRPDLFEIAGIPETELVDHLQQALWTVQNMRMDNLHLTVQRGITYREGGVTDPNALSLKPRFKWPVQDHDDIAFVAPTPLPPEAYQEEEALLSRMQLVTGINPYVSGSDMQGIDQNTATGITALQDVASRLLRFKAAQIQQKGLQRTYEQWSEMLQQFLDKDIAVRIEGPGKTFTWENYTPADIIGSYDITLEGAEESLSRQQERQEAIGLMNAIAPLAEMIDIRPVLERVAEAYNFPNPQALLKPKPQAPAAPGPTPPGPQGPGQMLQNGNPVMPQGMAPGIQQAITEGQ